MKFRERLFLYRLSWQTRPAVVAEYLQSKKNIVRSNCDKLDPRQVVAGAVQLEVKLFSDVREYLDEMHRFTALAAGEGVQLLVFPELNSLQLLGLIPGISKLAQQTGTVDTAALPVTELFRLFGPVFGRIVRQTFSWLALRGIWPRVQESTVYGLKSALVGDFLGWKLTGRAGIFAPLELTQNKDGVLAETVSAEEEGFVTARLDLVALRQLKDNHPYLGDINPGLEQKYFPAIYSGAVPFALSADDCSLARTSFSG